jgi:hypothetical protein
VANATELGDLALQAMAVLEEYAPGRATIGDAILLVEVQLRDGDGDQIATATHYFCTTRRSVVQRGLVESCRAGYRDGDEADVDDCLVDEGDD